MASTKQRGSFKHDGGSSNGQFAGDDDGRGSTLASDIANNPASGARGALESGIDVSGPGGFGSALRGLHYRHPGARRV